MTLLGSSWRLALPAQALVQKGAMLQRRSMVGLRQFAGFWTSWELDYLWFNVRVAAGRFLVPRLNVETVRQAFVMRDPAPARLSWGRSLATGVPTWFTDQIVEEAWGRERGQQVHLNRLVFAENWTSDHGDGLYRHELEHTLQAIRSPYPDVRVPDVALHRFVLAGAAERADQPALIDGPSGRALTYGQLAAGVERLAAGLTARGFRRGDVLALFMPNLPEFALAFHGTLAAGGVVTTVNSLATVQDAEYQLRNAGARFLVTVAPFLDRAAPAAAQVGIEQLFVVGEARGVTPFGALFDAGGSAPTAQPAAARDLAVLPYSSGTTGFPKGVMLTHRNLVANLIQTAAVHHVVAADRIIAVLPFFHIYGMQVVMNLALWQGATLVTMPRFELEPFLALLEAHRITRAFVGPPPGPALADA